MDWRVASSHYGMTVSEAEAFIGGILGDASGWEQAGIVARQTVDAPVVFEIVLEANGESPEYARTFWNQTPVLVQLEYPRIQAGFGTGITTHEAAHAYFWATHEGSGSVMTGDSPDGFPTTSDIESLLLWLGAPSEEGTGGAYWFPGDLEHYITNWPLADATEVRLYATVLGGVAGASLKAVWGLSHEAMLEGRFHDLTPSLPVESRGIYETGWGALPADITGDTWVGIIVRRETADTDLADLVIGLAEVDAR